MDTTLDCLVGGTLTEVYKAQWTRYEVFKEELVHSFWSMDQKKWLLIMPSNQQQ